MKKLIFLFLFFLSPIITFAGPADSIGIDINTITCPKGALYGICGGVNADLHNKFVSAMKKKDPVLAISYWNKMSTSMDGSDNDTLPNYLMEPLFGNYAPEGTAIISRVILAKKAYKGGIITLARSYHQDFETNTFYGEFYISYMRYKSDGMLYIYNTNLIPVNSKQYNTYVRLYSDSVVDFASDMTASFNKGKFNNKDTNAVYQKFIKSIR